MKARNKRFKDNESFFKFVDKYKDKINILSVSVNKTYILVRYEKLANTK